MMKRYFLFFVALLALGIPDCSKSNTGQMKVTIITLLTHPSLASAIEGFRVALAEKGYGEAKIDLTVENALGDISRVTVLARTAVDNGAKLIFVLTTPAAVAAMQVTNSVKVPLVYAAVTDPLAAGIVTSMTGSTTYATGVSDRYDVAKQFGYFTAIVPNMHSIGVLYSAGEQNSKILGDETAREAKARNIIPNIYVVEDVSRFPVLAKEALETNDAIIVNGDNKLTESLSVAINLAIAYKKPLFVGDPDSVRKGALATVGPSYFAMGKRAGYKAAEVLGGADVRSIPSEKPSGFDYIINMEAARVMGVTIPPTVWNMRTIWQSGD